VHVAVEQVEQILREIRCVFSVHGTILTKSRDL
jgi:hypothetical protein